MAHGEKAQCANGRTRSQVPDESIRRNTPFQSEVLGSLLLRDLEVEMPGELEVARPWRSGDAADLPEG